MMRLLGACVLAAVLASPIAAQEEQPGTEARSESMTALETIRQDLARRRFQRALASIGKLLADATLTEEERTEALVARAQAHLGRGELSAAEKDYRELLALRPELLWDESLGPAKAKSRFEKARKAVVGTIRLDVMPEDAIVAIDGREAHPDPEGKIPLAAGTHRLTGVRQGHDPLETTIEVQADQETPVTVRLAANSRTVVIRTEIEGVGVRLDGQDVGETARAGSEAPELRLEEVPVGEHVFELRKPCHRTEVLEQLLTVDLLERAPQILGPVSLEPLRGIVALRGVAREWEVVLNGSPVTRPPEDRIAVCPGTVTLEVRAGGRTVWMRHAEIEADAEDAWDIVPRPNAVILGAREAPEPLRSTFSIRAGPPLGSNLDPTRVDVWEKATLPPDTDLALVPLPSPAGAASPRWVLYSPILGVVDAPETLAPGLERPSWHATTIGARLADSRVGGSCRVVDLVEGAPAAQAGIRPGDRIVRVAGEAVSSAKAALDRIGALRPGATFPVEIVRGGETRTLNCTGADTVVLDPASASVSAAAVRAAWATVDAATLVPAEASAAWANLGLLLGRSGRHAQAVTAWNRVLWGDRAGLGAGTAAYYLGVGSAAQGEHEKARLALEKAASSAATTWRDDGPEVAPAARDRLLEQPTAR